MSSLHNMLTEEIESSKSNRVLTRPSA
jgi:hypothetical protein